MPREARVRVKVHIRKGDMVRVITGVNREKFRNTTARVVSVDPAKGVVTVEHTRMIKRHTRPNPAKNIKGGIVERERPIHISNVALVCPACNKTTRVSHKQVAGDDGKLQWVRSCHRCHNELGK